MLAGHLSSVLRDASPEQVVFAGKANERELGTAYTDLKDELKKKKPMQFLVREYAGQISRWAQDQAHWYPEGSGADSGEETNAKPEIWTGREEFDRLYAKFFVEATMLYEVADAKDYEAIGAELEVTADACSACHERFKKEGEYEFEF